MQLPSGDQTGNWSLAGSKVKRVGFPPVTLDDQRSMLLSEPLTTKRLSSAESLGATSGLSIPSGEPVFCPTVYPDQLIALPVRKRIKDQYASV
jgi:hypothetical protein